MRFTGAVGGRGRVEFSPAMVAGRPGSGAVRPGAGVSTERTRTAGSGAGRAWLRALATAGPWLRCLAGRCGASGSSRAGAHGPGGSGSSHPSPVRARPARRGAVAERNRAGGAGRFRRLAASLLVAIAASAFAAPALAQTTCNAPDLAGRTQIWTNTLNVGGPNTEDAYGFQPALDNSGTFTAPSNLSISYESNPSEPLAKL